MMIVDVDDEGWRLILIYEEDSPPQNYYWEYQQGCKYVILNFRFMMWNMYI